MQTLNLVSNHALTSSQVMRRSPARAVRAEARSVLFGVVGALAVSPVVGLVVNEASRLLDLGELGWCALILGSTVAAILVAGLLGTSRLVRASEAGASSWSALERDIADARLQNDLVGNTLQRLEAIALRLVHERPIGRRHRSTAAVPQGRVAAAAPAMQLGARNRRVAKAIVDRAVVRHALTRTRAAYVWLLPPAGAAAVGTGVTLLASTVQPHAWIALGAAFALTTLLTTTLTTASIRESLIADTLDRLEECSSQQRAMAALHEARARAREEADAELARTGDGVTVRRRGLQVGLRVQWLR